MRLRIEVRLKSLEGRTVYAEGPGATMVGQALAEQMMRNQSRVGFAAWGN